MDSAVDAALPDTNRQQNIGEALLVASLNGENVVGSFDRLVKIPFIDRLQGQIEAAAV